MYIYISHGLLCLHWSKIYEFNFPYIPLNENQTDNLSYNYIFTCNTLKFNEFLFRFRNLMGILTLSVIFQLHLVTYIPVIAICLSILSSSRCRHLQFCFYWRVFVWAVDFLHTGKRIFYILRTNWINNDAWRGSAPCEYRSCARIAFAVTEIVAHVLSMIVDRKLFPVCVCINFYS